MQETILREFEQIYGFAPTLLTRAPGRVNLIGEHTDYHAGFVLPMAIDRHVWVAARPRPDQTIRVRTLNFEEEASTFTLDQLNDKTLPHWTAPLRGAWALLGQQMSQPQGVDVLIHGDVPIGAGLSSSAAIEVALIELGVALVGGNMPQEKKALLGVDVEHQFMGNPCGVMDQMASAVSRAGHALLIDCRSLKTQPVYIPEGIAVVVMDTKTRHNHAKGDYATRRRESEEAAQILGVTFLRDAKLEGLEAKREELGDIRYRRAKHIITENERTLAAVDAFNAGDLGKAGALMNASHFSLRDDYEVSCDELDIMSEIARHTAGCYGARMTGGGFGGCAVGIVDHDVVTVFMSQVEHAYKAKTQLNPDLYAFQPAAGSEVVFGA